MGRQWPHLVVGFGAFFLKMSFWSLPETKFKSRKLKRRKAVELPIQNTKWIWQLNLIYAPVIWAPALPAMGALMAGRGTLGFVNLFQYCFTFGVWFNGAYFLIRNVWFYGRPQAPQGMCRFMSWPESRWYWGRSFNGIKHCPVFSVVDLFYCRLWLKAR